MKLCNHCGENKEDKLFYKSKDTKDGLGAMCKSCYKFKYNPHNKWMRKSEKARREESKIKTAHLKVFMGDYADEMI